MKFKDQFRFVWANMKKNKSRVFMTVLATAMGCAFLIVLASVGFGIERSVVSEITEGRLLTEISVHGKTVGSGYAIIKEKDIEYLESIKNVKTVTRRQMIAQQLTYNIEGYEAIGQALVVHLPSEIKAGFELSKGRMPKSSNEVVVGFHFQDQLKKNQNENPESYSNEILGKTMEVEIMQYVNEKETKTTISVLIVGIGKAPTREWNKDNNVFISEEILHEIEQFTQTSNGSLNHPGTPIEQINERLKQLEGEREYNEVKVYANNVEDIKEITKAMKAKDFMTHSIANELEQVNAVFIILKIGLIFVGTIAILIASIGIYNTMTMAVTERAQDIGIMKAIGAHPSTIKKIFLIESSYIGLLGAIIGTIVSYGISYTVNIVLPFVIENFLGEKPPENLQFSYIPISLTIICVAISLGVAILSGMRPAKRATQVDVLKAMRRDI